MSHKLWQKSSTKLHPLIEKYTVGVDYKLDMKLLPYDIQASKAHAEGLQRIGVLTTDELKQLLKSLDQLLKLHEQGKVEIRIQDEDGHTVIEHFLVEKCGEAGKKIHTGRSRNDQVLVAMRLYMKDQLLLIQKAVKKTAKVFLQFAEEYQDVPLPGYSHQQQAMLSSVGHWASSFVEALLDDGEILQSALHAIDKNPLGAAAGFGVSFPLDREFTTKQLGFKSVQTNSLYCMSSRGKFEAHVVEGLVQLMLTLGRFAQDMLLFTTQEFGFFTVDDSLLTGSSIMPQKKNHDALEVLRGNVSRVVAHQNQLLMMTKGLISGYNRELQNSKLPVMESFEIILDSLEIVSLYVQHMKPNTEVMESRITPGIFAADIANRMVKEEGIPFREAYQKAMEKVGQEKPDFQKNLRSKKSLGSPGNLSLEDYQHRIHDLK